MRRLQQLFLAAALATSLPVATDAQTRATGDRDDQFVATGCVMPTADFRSAGPQSLFVWSRGDVYLAFADVRIRPAETDRPIGTTGPFMPVFYWIDDENDFAKYAGQHVEIVGELSDELRGGEIEIESKGEFTEIEFDAGGREASARIPTVWFGPATRGRDIEKDVVVRTVDVEKVTVLGECKTR
jgi:hypothetical protein